MRFILKCAIEAGIEFNIQGVPSRVLTLCKPGVSGLDLESDIQRIAELSVVAGLKDGAIAD